MMTYNNGTCALQFPSHYVPVTEEEMEYIDGGYYLSKAACTGVVAAIGLNPCAIALGYVGVTLARKVVTRVSAAIGGFVGWAAGVLISAAMAYVGAQLVAMAKGIIAGAKYNGVDFTFEINFGKNKWGLDYCVR